MRNITKEIETIAREIVNEVFHPKQDPELNARIITELQKVEDDSI